MNRPRRPSPEDMETWDAILKKEDRGILTHKEESMGVNYGAEGGDAVVEESTSKMDRRIAEKLREEGGNNEFAGSPENYILLEGAVINFGEIYGFANCKLGVHESCISSDPCVVVKIPDGKKYHFNTRKIKGFDSYTFIEKMQGLGFDTVPEDKIHG